jgi:putative hydrolase of the HAD superfamily
MTLKAVIFDLGGVVLDSPLQVFRKYEAELGLSPGLLSHIITGNGESGAWPRMERGELEMSGFFTAFDAEAAVRGAAIRATDLMDRVDLLCQPRASMLDAIRAIRRAGLATAALTNNWLSDDQHQKMALLRPEFDVFIESAREGLRKPDPRIYRLACERLACSPNEVVFLDDIGENLKPARQLGMTTIKVIDPAVALAELGALLGLELTGCATQET